ncbi:DUF305 domain-containing protein [Deinococcus koreensis]|uniref:DUF305 domain-containing protein n=1 Tax=Deinococcus koreensis TaxID=2054903 RepID=A0A2K3UYT9_9DEIO|nr:DUF305 domain-containing protein [Deinococcus koreensis]PNY81685.1 DUF305 domain-containing protein [Deinococcus koreensis]
MIRALLGTLALTGSALAAMPGMDHGQMGPAPATMPGMATGSTPAMMKSMGDQMVRELTPLRGRAFDVRFAQRMADHHQMAIDMARMEVRGGKDARVKASAQKVIADQQREIALMKGWIKTWTGQSYTPKSMAMAHGGSADRWFLEGMIPHHVGAIAMAKLVPTRTQSAPVRALATAIIKAQQAEIDQYTGWLRAMK